MAGLKTADNQQWGLVSADGTSAPLTAGEGGEPLIDLQRRVFVIPVLDPPPFPLFPTRWQQPNAGGAETRQLLAVAGVLEQVSGFVAAAAGDVRYVQLFDLAAGPPGAAVPFHQIPTVGLSTYSYAPGRGWEVSNGILIAVSTTPDAFTAGAGAIMRSSATGWQ